MYRIRAAYLSAVLALSGCAFSVYDVSVNYQYADTVSANLNGAPVRIGAFTDTRAVSNPRLLFHQKNMNGQTTTGGWQAEKPLAEIVRDGVEQALTAAKGSIRPDSDIEITGQLMDFSSEAIMGVWRGELNARLLLKFQLSRLAEGEVIWNDTYLGSASVDSGGAEGMFRAALDSALKQLMSDKHFIQELTKGRPSQASGSSIPR